MYHGACVLSRARIGSENGKINRSHASRDMYRRFHDADEANVGSSSHRARRADRASSARGALPSASKICAKCASSWPARRAAMASWRYGGSRRRQRPSASHARWRWSRCALSASCRARESSWPWPPKHRECVGDLAAPARELAGCSAIGVAAARAYLPRGSAAAISSLSVRAIGHRGRRIVAVETSRCQYSTYIPDPSHNRGRGGRV